MKDLRAYLPQDIIRHFVQGLFPQTVLFPPILT